ncbi:TetR/AcrR family transcriptional regulator [Yinghuangia aomiensis]|uniref:TetR/AcrR family transcriptional regulator n=1 Tax=Yinghuangia aomiensis TaxID=676205 RepID=A0ABP9HVA1_9ACTN
MDAAAQLFAERGYHAAGVSLIASRVQITGGGIYRHFRSKEEILEVILRQVVDRATAMATAAGSTEGSPQERLRKLVGQTVQHAVDRPAHVATHFRERQVPSVPRHEHDLTTGEDALAEQWRSLVLQATPRLGAEQADLRYHAVEGVVGTLAALGHRNPRPVSDVLAQSLMALLTAPPAPRPPRGNAAAARVRTWQPPTSRENDILAVALGLFRQRGFSGVLMEEIAGGLGMGTSSLYQYYTGKSDILADAYDRVISRLMVGVETQLDAAESAEDALDRLVRSYVRLTAENIDLVVVTTHEFQAMPELERPRVTRRRRYLRESWAAVLRELRPELTAEEAKLLATCALPLISHVLLQADDPRGAIDELTYCTLTFLLDNTPRQRGAAWSAEAESGT